MTINVQNNTSFTAFINVSGNKETTPTEEHNKAVEAFISKFNEGSLTVEAFKGKDGKWVIGFR